jgi:hypothetical protein
VLTVEGASVEQFVGEEVGMGIQGLEGLTARGGSDGGEEEGVSGGKSEECLCELVGLHVFSERQHRLHVIEYAYRNGAQLVLPSPSLPHCIVYNGELCHIYTIFHLQPLFQQFHWPVIFPTHFPLQYECFNSLQCGMSAWGRESGCLRHG